MSVTPLASPRRPDALAEARVHLAAAYRLAVLHELEEGIDNHLTMRVPGQEGRYLILPFGLHWSEASASNLVIYDDSGATVEGTGTVERSAHCIHTPIHRLAGAAVVLHTHQTWALALNSLQDNRLLPMGWRKDGPFAADTAPVGVDSDPDFTAGGDTVHFSVPIEKATPKLIVYAWMRYQTIPPAWVAPLRTLDAEEAKTFVRLYDAADKTPEVLGFATRAEDG